MSAESSNQSPSDSPPETKFLVLTEPVSESMPHEAEGNRTDRQAIAPTTESGMPARRPRPTTGGQSLHAIGANHFEERMIRQCRQEQFGIPYRLDDSHQWGDFWIASYRWTASDIRNYDQDNKLLPVNFHVLSNETPGFLVTVAVLDQHSSEMTTTSVRTSDIIKIKKARRGGSFLIHVPAVARKAENSPVNNVDWPRVSTWIAIPPSQLDTQQVDDMIHDEEPTEYGPLVLKWDTVTTKYFAPNHIDTKGFVRLLVDLLHDGEALVNADFVATKVIAKEVMRTAGDVKLGVFYP